MTRSVPVRLAVTGALAASLTLAACGQSENMDGQGGGDDGGGDGQVQLRYDWWGSGERQQINEQLIEMFEADHPNVDIVPSVADWGGYWDKLSTTVAGGDTPDVMMQEERYLREYGSRGVVADLSQHDIATDAIDPTILAGGQFDGGLYGIPTGVNVYTLLANPRVFEEAGVEMPDDETWSWEEYQQLAAEIVENSPEGVHAMQDHGNNEAGFNVYARQHGQSLYTEDGELGYEDELLIDWWNIALKLQQEGGQPPASRSSELVNVGPEQSLMGQGDAAMSVWWSNSISPLESASGDELQLLRWPGESTEEHPGMYYKPAMFVSMSATTDHPEEAAEFIDFMINSVEAGEVILSDRGLAANLDVREATADMLPEPEQRAAAFLKDLEDEIVDGPPVPPVGSGEVQEILTRYNDEVLFGRMTPEDAAAQFREEVEAAVETS